MAIVSIASEIEGWKPSSKASDGSSQLFEQESRKAEKSSSLRPERSNASERDSEDRRSKADSIESTNSSRDLNGGKYTRTPWIITCERWIRQTPKQYIAYNTNPSDFRIDLARRGSLQRTHGGAVKHSTPRRRFEMHGNMDDFEATFTIQTGNIIPVKIRGKGRLTNWDHLSSGSIVNREVPHGINALAMLLELLDQRNLYGGKTNYALVFGSSKLIPSFVLKGFFKETGPSLEESVEDISSKKIPMTIDVLSSRPSFRNAAEFTKLWSSGAFSI